MFWATKCPNRNTLESVGKNVFAWYSIPYFFCKESKPRIVVQTNSKKHFDVIRLWEVDKIQWSRIDSRVWDLGTLLVFKIKTGEETSVRNVNVINVALNKTEWAQ